MEAMCYAMELFLYSIDVLYLESNSFSIHEMFEYILLAGILPLARIESITVPATAQTAVQREK